MKTRPPKVKRCNLWDDNKKPRRVKGGATGCWRSDSDCFFVHPTEKEWDTADSSFPPRAHEVIDDDSEFFYEMTSRNRKSSNSTVTPDSHRDRRQYASPSKDGRNGRRSRSPATSVAESDKLEKLRRDDGYHRRTSIAGSSSSYSRRRSPPLDDRGRRGDRARSPIAPRRLSPSRPQISIKPVMPPPPPPPPSRPPHPPQGTPPTRPPPPVPLTPSFLSIDISQRAPEKSRALSADELRKVWHERVDLLFASVKAREQLSVAESDLKLYKAGESSCMTGASTTRITTQRHFLETQCETKKAEIFDTIQKLTASEFWPALKPPDLQSVEAKFFGMKQQISALKDSVSDLGTSFSAFLRMKDLGTASRDSGEPPLKKRRLEEGEVAPADASEATFSLSALDGIQERLGGVERQLDDLENDIFQRDTIVGDEIDSRIQGRLEEEEIFPDEDDTKLSSAAVIAVVQAETGKALDTINTTDQELRVVAQEVEGLMMQTKGTEDKATRLSQENEQLKTKIVELKSSTEAYAKLAQQNDERVEALAAALQAYISQAPPPPPTPVVPTHEYLMEELEEHIHYVVNKYIEPLLRDIRDDVTNMLDKDSAAMYHDVWPKIELVLRMVETVKKGSNIILEPKE